ncbi:hypothetical protein [Rhodopseudomonas sp. P2A-2r]|uniref:hypothetical protein n=1 Tax=unclassified Rhodopseudomonas TaxID=2638247 RepID=UPI0022341982|nr:hypothetical protein [Rhodopseudomonas sp. P2A-2r]UZE49313.1 hypothetical protein ONR75_00055 [Rhodopseudomonas sp. P2A-2r]
MKQIDLVRFAPEAANVSNSGRLLQRRWHVMSPDLWHRGSKDQRRRLCLALSSECLAKFDAENLFRRPGLPYALFGLDHVASGEGVLAASSCPSSTGSGAPRIAAITALTWSIPSL